MMSLFHSHPNHQGISVPRNLFKGMSLLLFIFVCLFIFMNSAENGTQSRKKSETLTETVSPLLIKDYNKLDAPTKTIKKASLEDAIRSLGHAGEFALLGFSAALCVLSFSWEKNLSGKQRALCFAGAWLFCILYACSDEIHQLFVPSRAFEIKDILIDSSGALLGEAIPAIPFLLHRMRKKKVRPGVSAVN